jgi:hypothetical protein
VLRNFCAWYQGTWDYPILIIFLLHLAEAFLLQRVLSTHLIIRKQNNFPILFFMLFSSMSIFSSWSVHHLTFLIFSLVFYLMTSILPQIQQYQKKLFHASLLTGVILILSPISWYISLVVWLFYIFLKDFYRLKEISILLLGQLIVLYFYYSLEVLSFDKEIAFLSYFTKDFPSILEIWKRGTQSLILVFLMLFSSISFFDLVKFYPRKKKIPRALTALLVGIFLIALVVSIGFSHQIFPMILFVFALSAVLSNYFEFSRKSKFSTIYLLIIIFSFFGLCLSL